MKTREHSDLYLTYDSYKNVLHATRSSNGTDGFLRYLHDDAEHIIREGHNPNVWVSYVHFHDGGDVPDLREAGRHGFFDRVLDTIRRSGGECRYTANMRDVLFCIEQDIVPLTPAAERTLLMARPDYPALEEEMARSYPRQNAVIPEYRSYDALESRQGVMLFSRTTEGQRQRREYEHRLELNFYNPAQPGGPLRYWEIIAVPDRVAEMVDRLSVQEHDPQAQLYADAHILGQGRILQEFDMTANAVKYDIFRRRTQPGQRAVQPLSEMTVGQLWKHITHMTRPRFGQQTALCVDRKQFPGEQPDITCKIRR